VVENWGPWAHCGDAKRPRGSGLVKVGTLPGKRARRHGSVAGCGRVSGRIQGNILAYGFTSDLVSSEPFDNPMGRRKAGRSNRRCYSVWNLRLQPHIAVNRFPAVGGIGITRWRVDDGRENQGTGYAQSRVAAHAGRNA